MAILKGGQAKYPFWGLPFNYITGLDPLGLQTTSEATYSFLLPGISNLTNRMRYYGFYCWLLNLYENRQKKVNKQDQFRFLRRGEFLASVIMASESPETPQITGSNFTKPLVHRSGGTINISDGADLEDGKSTYWKFPSGAFGQYYLGPLMALGWVMPVASTEDVHDFIYKTIPDREGVEISGKGVGEDFGQNISKAAEDLFYTAIMKGFVSRKEVRFLYDYFYLDLIETESKEWESYHKALMGRDYPLKLDETQFTYHRSNTIRDLVQFCNSENNRHWDWIAYLEHVYRQKPISDNGVDETRTGWYHYQLNEYWHYAAGSIFWSLLVELRNRVDDQPLTPFVREFADVSSKAIKDIDSKAMKSKSFRLLIDGLTAHQEFDLMNETAEAIKDGDHIRALGLGWLLLFVVIRNNEKQLRELQLFAEHRGILRDGSVTEIFLSMLDQEQKPPNVFIHDFLLRYIINRHQYVALRKMGNGTTCSFKFLLEERYIRFREVFSPRPTSPRLNALTNLLFDLGVIDEENTITDISKTF